MLATPSRTNGRFEFLFRSFIMPVILWLLGIHTLIVILWLVGVF